MLQVRRLFARARAAAPCVLFFDDLDALFGKRDLEGILELLACPFDCLTD